LNLTSLRIVTATFTVNSRIKGQAEITSQPIKHVAQTCKRVGTNDPVKFFRMITATFTITEAPPERDKRLVLVEHRIVLEEY
jgi:hypothetical protein